MERLGTPSVQHTRAPEQRAPAYRPSAAGLRLSAGGGGNMKTTLFRISFALLATSCCSYAQHLGVATLPEDLPKTAILIEKARTQRVEQYVPIQGFTLPTNSPPQIGSNVYIKIWADETVYDPRGSGVILVLSNYVFVATANHVVSPDGDVCFRVPQKNNAPPRHQPHLPQVLDWVRDTNTDLAVAPLGLSQSTDDIKAIPIQSLCADYDEVNIGDEVFVLGFPSSVLFTPDPSVHYVRNGIVASKQGRPRIVVDAFLFPGNSGGPVFWKQSMALHFGENITGPDIPGREPKLIGIVSQVLNYSEEAKSAQTGRTRVTFEENSGLAVVISSSALLELMRRPEIASQWQSPLK